MKINKVIGLSLFTLLSCSNSVIANTTDYRIAKSYYTSGYDWFYFDGYQQKKAPSLQFALEKDCDRTLKIYGEDEIETITYKKLSCEPTGEITNVLNQTWTVGAEAAELISIVGNGLLKYQKTEKINSKESSTIYSSKVSTACNEEWLKLSNSEEFYLNSCESDSYSLLPSGNIQGSYTLTYSSNSTDNQHQISGTVEISGSVICDSKKKELIERLYGDTEIKDFNCNLNSAKKGLGYTAIDVDLSYSYTKISKNEIGANAVGVVATKKQCDDPSFSYGPVTLNQWGHEPAVCFPSKNVADKNLGEPFCMAGNPINTLTGNKYQAEVDSSIGTLTITRAYNSQSSYGGFIGNNWSSFLDRKLTISSNTISAQRESGQAVLFRKNKDNWQTDQDVQLMLTVDGNPVEITDEDVMEQVKIMLGMIGRDISSFPPEVIESLKKSARLTLELQAGSSFEVDRYIITSQEWIESYNKAGQLISLQKRYQPEVWTLAYNESSKPSKLTNNFGDEVILAWETNHLKSLIINNSYKVTYEYNNGPLAKVITPSGTRSYHYEDERHPNALTGISIAGQRYATWTYDDQGRAISSEHAGQTEKSQLVFNEDHTLVTNAYGKQTRYFFDSIQHVKRPARVEGAASAHCVAANQNYTYTPEGFTESSTDWNGNITRYQYNKRGLPTKIIYAADTAVAQTVENKYHPTHDLPVEILTATLKTTITYNDLGQPLTQIIKDLTGNSPDQATEYKYNEKGLLKNIDGPRTDVADITHFAYNPKGKLVKTTNAVGHISEVLNYNALGQPTKTKDANGIITELGYTRGGQLSSSTIHGPNGRLTTQYTYNKKGQVKTITDHQGVTLSHHYTPAGYLAKLCNSANECTEYERDVTGKSTSIKIKDSTGTIVSQQQKTYDELGRLLATLGNNGQQVQFTRDANGNITSINNQLTGTTNQAFDALNRLIKQVEPNSTTTNYQQQPQGLAAVDDAEEQTTAYTRDGFGHVVAESSPQRGVTTYVYDEAGNLVAKEDANGNSISYQYDALNRIVHANFGDEALNTTYTYDGDIKGALSSVSKTQYQATYQYNKLGSPTFFTQVINGKSYQFSFAYNAKNQRTTITYPSGKKLILQYNSLGKISGLTWDGQPVITDIEYVAFGPISQWQYGNGLSLTNSHDLDLRLTQKQVGSLINNEYSYDSANRITAIEHQQQSESFSYNNLNQLLSATGSYGQLAFTYDKTGSRQTSESGSGETQYSYEAGSQQLSQIIAGDTTTDLGYDNNGNIVRYGDKVFHYNSDNRLTRVSQRNQVVAEYVYNPAGLRTQKITPNKTTHYIYDDSGTLLAEANSNGDIEREYVSLGLEPVAFIESNSAHYIHTGHLNQPLAVTSQSGEVVWQASWKPFGEVELLQEQITLNLRFPGQYFDAESGLYYNNQRYYSPKLGRYTTSDPIGLKGGFNTYGYAFQNPLSFIDKDGKAASLTWCFGGPFACAAGILTAGTAAWYGAQATSVLNQSSKYTSYKSNSQACSLGSSGPTAPCDYFPEVCEVEGKHEFKNQLPEQLQSELDIAEKLGVSPVRAGTAEFEELVNTGRIKWAVTKDGSVRAIPHTVNGQEISHAVISRGSPVLAAGEADIAAANGTHIGLDLTTHSGHFMNGANATMNQAARQVAIEAFKKAGITFP